MLYDAKALPFGIERIALNNLKHRKSSPKATVLADKSCKLPLTQICLWRNGCKELSIKAYFLILECNDFCLHTMGYIYKLTIDKLFGFIKDGVQYKSD